MLASTLNSLLSAGEHFRYVGVDVGRINTRVVVTGQDGEVLVSISKPTKDAEEPEKCIEYLCEQVRETLKKSTVDEKTIVGIGIAMPGSNNKESTIFLCGSRLWYCFRNHIKW